VEESVTYTFCPEKNLKLKHERDISFEEVITAIEQDQLLDIVEHPNRSKYANQKMYVVALKSMSI